MVLDFFNIFRQIALLWNLISDKWTYFFSNTIKFLEEKSKTAPYPNHLGGDEGASKSTSVSIVLVMVFQTMQFETTRYFCHMAL